jgi:simple sugar transport system substrate-binding protein
MLRKAIVVVMVLLIAMSVAVSAQSPFKDIRIRYFVGGDEGDMFATVVYNGAKAAAQLMGCKVDYVFSGWSAEKMTQQLREAIAAKPDAISMMGHPGDAALKSLVKQAQDAGILITIVNVDVPDTMNAYKTGYVGAYIEGFGYRLGKRAIEKFGIKKGDTVIIDGNWGAPGLEKRDVGVARAFEEIGCKIVKIRHSDESAGSPNLFQPQVAGAVAANPTAKLISYSGGQLLGASSFYMQSIGKKPGEIKNIGFDITPQIIDGFEKGYVSLTIDQEPYLQGFLPIVSLCMAVKYGLAPITVDTGVGFVDETNYKAVSSLAKQGIR